MYKIIIILLSILPFCSFGQNTSNEALMRQLGYEKVDLEALKKEQSVSNKACSSCPLKQAGKKTVFNPTTEIDKLKQQIPTLEAAINDPNTDPSMLTKYQTALQNTKDRIKALEKVAQSKTTSKQ